MFEDLKKFLGEVEDYMQKNCLKCYIKRMESGITPHYCGPFTGSLCYTLNRDRDSPLIGTKLDDFPSRD